MTFEELVERTAARSEMPKARVKEVLRAGLSTIVAALKAGEEVVLPDVGKFAVADVEAKMGRNPATGEPMAIPARRRVKFAAAGSLKRSMNPPA